MAWVGIWVHRQMWLEIVVFLSTLHCTRSRGLWEMDEKIEGKGVLIMTAPLRFFFISCILSCQYILNYWHSLQLQLFNSIPSSYSDQFPKPFP